MSNWILGFYVIGVILSCLLGLSILWYEEKKAKDGEPLQGQVVSVMALLSWVAIVMLAWGWVKKKKEGS